MSDMTREDVVSLVSSLQSSYASALQEAIDNKLQDYEKAFELLSSRIDTLDQLHASLMIAYAEATNMIQAVVEKLMASSNEDEQKDFAKRAASGHSEMMEFIKAATQSDATEQTEKHLNETIGKMADS